MAISPVSFFDTWNIRYDTTTYKSTILIFNLSETHPGDQNVPIIREKKDIIEYVFVLIF